MTSEAEDGLRKLKSKLQALMDIADTFAKGPQDTSTHGLAKRLDNLAKYVFSSFMSKCPDQCRSEISKLRSSVNNKSGRDRLTEAVPLRVNVDDITALDDAISPFLGVFHVSSGVSIHAPPSDLFVDREWRCGWK